VHKLLFVLGLAAMTSGCAGLAASAIPSSLLPSSPNAAALEIHNQTDVKLTEANFVTAKTNVIGQCKGFSLFGIITLVPARFTIAMDRLYAGAQMQTGRAQTLADVIVEKTSSYWILFSIPRVTVRADVVEFVPSSAELSIPTPPPAAEQKPTSASIR
jgi:hypothetical protein